MSKVEELGNSMVKLTLEVSSEDFEKGIQKAYAKNKNQIQIPGFRRGKAPLKMVEKMYGREIFYEDALNDVLPDLYEQAVKEEGLEVMSRPDVSVGEIEEGKPVEVTFEVAVKPEVKLPDLTSMTKDEEKVEVTDEDVEEELKKTAKQQARKVEVTDRAAQMDDVANIDYEGSVDGVPFDGGKAEGYDLTLGSHSFIPGFEEGVVGMEIGEEKDIDVTFPEEYHADELAGKAAVFKVKLNSLKAEELPEIDDEFVKEVSEFDTLEDYKKDLKTKIQEQKETAEKNKVKNHLLDQLVEGAEIEIPDAILDEQSRELINDFAMNLRYQGMDMDTYMKYTGTTMQALLQSARPQAEKRLRENLCLEAVAKKAELEVSDEDLEAELKTMADNYGMELTSIKSMIGEGELDNIKADLLNRKALDYLYETAK